MKELINIKNVYEALVERKMVEVDTVEDNLFDFTVLFYHGVSLLKPTSTKKTTKAFITFILTQCMVKFIRALRVLTEEAIADLNACGQPFGKIIDLTNDEICNNFIAMFNCETDNVGAFSKLAALYALATTRMGITNADIIECLKTIN